MKITDLFSAKSIAAQYTEVASNSIPYLGTAFFPAKKKLGLDLKWIKGNKGLPVSLAPSNFDAKSTLRGRVGIETESTQMAFFRESMLVKEEDEQEIMRVQEANDPYAQQVIEHIYDDANTLLAGADVVPERMRMQLLAPTVDGSPRITISSNGVQYSYNYDPDASYKTNNYLAIATATKKWDDHANSDPMSDVSAACDAVEAQTGVRPSIMLVSKATMNHLRQNANIRSAILAQNATANIFMTDALVSTLRKRVECLEKELRSTSQRVNLFEKVKIPEAKENIRIIGVYLGDQQTAAVVRGKISKKKLTGADA